MRLKSRKDTSSHSKVCFLPWPSPWNRQWGENKNSTTSVMTSLFQQTISHLSLVVSIPAAHITYHNSFFILELLSSIFSCKHSNNDMLLRSWSHRYTNSKVVITYWLNVEKYSDFSNPNESFSFYVDFFLSFFFSCSILFLSLFNTHFLLKKIMIKLIISTMCLMDMSMNTCIKDVISSEYNQGRIYVLDITCWEYML